MAKRATKTEAAKTPLPDKPLVFMHIPRTGGHTLRAILSEVYGDALCPAENWTQLCETKDITRYKVFHAHVGRQIESLLGVVPDYATFLREPLSRMWSLYHRLKASGHIEASTTFERYVTRLAPSRGEFNEMTRYLSDSDDAPQAIAMLKQCVFVGKFERFGGEITRLASHLGWVYTPDIPKLDATDNDKVSMVGISAHDHENLFAANVQDLILYDYAEEHFWSAREASE